MLQMESGDGDFQFHTNSLISACTESNWSRVDALLQHDLNPNVRDKSGRTAFHLLCEFGQYNLAALLLKKGADINARYNFGRTALHVAGEAGREDLVAFLIKCGANLEAKDNVGRTVLQRVCYKGYLVIATVLLNSGANINAQDETGSSPLHSACEKGHTHITTLLLERGSNINCRDNFGRSPLHLACLYDHLETVHWLCDHGAELDAKDIDGRTALHVTCFKDHTEVVAFLLTAGANLEAAANDGRTPLHCACIKGNTETIFYILERHANTEAMDVMGLTPLHCSCDASQLESASTLLDSGANIEAKDLAGKTPMLRACEKGMWRIASYLKDRGAQLAPGFEFLGTAMKHAHYTPEVYRTEATSDFESVEMDTLELFVGYCESGNGSEVDRCINQGVDMDKAGKDGYMGIHKACVFGHVDIVMLLLDNGADIEARTKDGYTPLYCACENGHVDLVYALLHRTADVDAKADNGKTALYVACDWGLSEDTAPVDRSMSPSGGSGGIGGAGKFHSRSKAGLENCYNRHVELAAALLEYGADPSLKPPGYGVANPCEIVDSSGNLILHRALIQSTYLSSFEESYFIGIVTSLLKAFPGGARVKNKASQFPLNIALENDVTIDIVGPLIEATMLRRQEMSAIFRSALNSSWCNIDSLQYMLYALQHKQVLSNVNIHFCGEDNAGKTTTTRALTYLMQPPASTRRPSVDAKTSSSAAVNGNDLVEPVSWLGVLSPARKVKPILSGSAGRTHGLNINPINNGKVSWLIHDYGGNRIYHPCHGCFLARPRSVYVIFVNPYDFQKKSLLSDSVVVEKYQYWLRFINSVAHRPLHGEAPPACITVVNMMAEVEALDRGRTKRVKDLIALEQLKWLANGCSNIKEPDEEWVPPSARPEDKAEQGEFKIPFERCGFMSRQSEVQKSWRKRYYVLTHGTLRYYKTDPTGGSNTTATVSATAAAAASAAAAFSSQPGSRSTSPGPKAPPSPGTESSPSSGPSAAIPVVTADITPSPHNFVFSVPKPAGEMFLQGYVVRQVSESRFMLVNPNRKSRELVLEVEDADERREWISAFKEHISFLRTQFRIQLIGEPLVANLSLTSEVNSLLHLLDETISTLNLQVTAASRCVEAVLALKAGGGDIISTEKVDHITTKKWPSVTTRQVLREKFILPALRLLKSSDAINVDESVFFWLCSLVLRQLVDAGEVVLASSEDGKMTWAVTDVNWLTRDLVGKLTASMYAKDSTVQPILTIAQLNEFTGDASSLFGGDVNVYPQLLRALGVCIPVTDQVGPYIPQPEEMRAHGGTSFGMLIFPMFVDIACNSSEIRPMQPPAESSKFFRQIIRRFQLLHPATQSHGFPTGYFPSLFSAVAELEHNTRDIIITKDSLIVQRCYSLVGAIENKVEIIIVADEGCDSFTVTVSTLMAHPSRGGQSYAWKRMQSICDIVRRSSKSSTGLRNSIARSAAVIVDEASRDYSHTRNNSMSTKSKTSIYMISDDDDELNGSVEVSSDHVSNWRQSLGMVLTWIKNVDVIELCVSPLDCLMQKPVFECMTTLTGSDSARKQEVCSMYFGIDERRQAVKEDGLISSCALASAATSALRFNEEEVVTRNSMQLFRRSDLATGTIDDTVESIDVFLGILEDLS